MVTGIGFYAYQNGQIKVPSSNTPLGSPPPVTRQVSDGTPTDWKTYTNKQLGFSFKYPNQLDKSEDVKSPMIFSIFQEKSSIMGDKQIQFKPWHLYGSYSNFKSLDEVLKNIKNVSESQFNFDIKSTSINGNPAIRYKHCEMSCAEIVILSHNGKFINFQLYTTSDIGIGEPKVIFDQILSSFKFVGIECKDGEYLKECKLGPCCCPVGAMCD